MRNLLRPALKPKVLTTTILLLTGVLVTVLVAMVARHAHYVESALVVGSFLTVVAAILQWFRPRIAYVIAVIGGLIPLAWLVETEMRGPWSCGINSWIAFNLNTLDRQPWPEELLYFGGRILTSFLLLISIALASWRLLPRKWSLRGKPISQGTWPAVAIGLAGIIIWYVAGAYPYRVPVIIDGIFPQMRVLHVTKKGLQYQETSVSVFRDHRFYVHRNSRRLFQYRFDETVGESVLPDSNFARLRQTVQSLPQLVAYKEVPPVAQLRKWDDEGWYVLLERDKIAQFTKSNSVPVPVELTALFRELESVPLETTDKWFVRDICFGFCYDPIAGLGFDALNLPCSK